MNFALVLGVLGRLLTVYGLTMFVPLIITLIYQRPDSGMNEIAAFVWSPLITVGCGIALRLRFRASVADFGHRESIAVVAIGWIMFSVFGALPWMLLATGHEGQPLALSAVDAIFETMSGLTTCGSSILSNIEQYGHGVLFWRAMTHWMGGMGIVVLVVAILPGLGVGGYQLLRAEVPGPSADKIAPRIVQTARILWFLYVLLTVLQIVLLWAPSWFVDSAVVRAPGSRYMTLYEATCHAFATLATGGFSTRNASLGAYGAWHQYVCILFMFLAGTNFLLHWQLITGRPMHYLRNPE
ncbi:MAG: TrkH family potassium uptake protein [Planctomycetota bacterium]